MVKAQQTKRPIAWIIVVIAAVFLIGYVSSILLYTIHPKPPQTKTYTGTFPCADCSGLVTTLTLMAPAKDANHGFYLLHELYEGKTSTPFVTEGTWTRATGAPFDSNASILVLQTKGQITNYWMKNNDTLQFLDSNRQKISSPFNETLVALGTTQQSTQSSLANPASVYCKKVGGNLVIQKRGDGGEYGLCQFEDNQACEEWALYRGACPVGGVKTTGFDNIQQQYCAWGGGKTLAVENATCTLPNGKVCTDEALYNGTCSQE